MDSRFYDKSGNFTPIYHVSENKFVSCVPIVGLGRPQSDVDVLVGGDGNFLTVVENMETGKAEKENPENWDAHNDERFLEEHYCCHDIFLEYSLLERNRLLCRCK